MCEKEVLLKMRPKLKKNDLMTVYVHRGAICKLIKMRYGDNFVLICRGRHKRKKR